MSLKNFPTGHRLSTRLTSTWTPTRLARWGLTLALLCCVGGIGYIWRLGSVGLVDETEPLFAEAARHMLSTGDWITPYFNGETRFDKPPLIYWCMAVAYRVVGVNEWGARLPSALAAIASVTFVAIALLRFGNGGQSIEPVDTSEPIGGLDWLSAWLGMSITALTPLTIAWGRTGVSDMLLTACICGTMVAFFHAYAASEQRAKTYWYLTCYTAVGLGILTKGPVAIVLPALGIGAFLLHVRRFWTVVREMALVHGLFLVGALCVPWFIAVSAIHGSSYIDSFFGYHNFDRFTSVVNNHSAPWYFYALVVLGGFAPFSIYLPVAIARLQVWKLSQWRQQPRSSHLGVFAFWWFVSIFAFFSASVTKLPSYLLPLLPATAILVALWWRDRFFPSSSDKSSSPTQQLQSDRLHAIGLWVQVGANILLFVALAIASLFLTSLLGEDSSAPDLLPAIEAARLPLWGGLIWGIAAAIALGVALLSRWRWVPAINIAGMLAFVVLLVAVAFPLMDVQRQLPLRQLSQQAAEELLPNEQVVAIGFMKPSITFYLQQNVHYASGPRALKRFIDALQAEPEPSSYLLLGTIDDFENFRLERHPYERLQDAGAYRLARMEL
ncbi:MAG: glycosyltransferase family 39 protein [Cyanobacteria bacterium J06597_1]